MPMGKLGRFGLALSNPSALAQYDVNEESRVQQQRQLEQQQVQFQAKQKAQQNQRTIDTALQIIDKAEPGSQSYAFALLAIKDAGMDDENLLNALRNRKGRTKARNTKVVGRSLVEIPEEGPVEELFRGPAGSGTTVNVGGSNFGEDLIEKQLGSIFESGRGAAGISPRLREAYELLSDPNLNTGSIPTKVSGLQSLANDLGVDLNAATSKLGFNLGDLATKEQFNRVTRELVLQNAEKLKGALNKPELKLLEDSTANPVFTEEANIDAIASAMAGAELAKARGELATFVTTAEEARSLVRQSMGGSTEKFLELKEQFVSEMKASRGQKPKAGPQQNVSLPQGAQLFKTLKNGRKVFKAPDGQLYIED